MTIDSSGMFERSTAAQLLVDTDTGAILDANPAAASFYGWPRATMRAMLLSDLDTTSADALHHVMHAHGRGTDEEAGSDGGASGVRTEHRTANGDRRSVRLYPGLVAVGGRDVLHVVVQDNGDRAVVGRAGHDLNNALTVVRGSAGFLRDAFPPGAQPLDDVAAIERAADRAESIARRLLAFGRDEPAPAEATSRTDAQATAQAERRVVVIEPDAAMRELMRRMIVSLGHAVHVVSSENEALDAMQAMPSPGSPQGARLRWLVISALPTDDLQAMAFIGAAESSGGDVAFVAVTSYPVAPDVRAALDARGIPLLTKPYTRDALSTAIAKAVAERRRPSLRG